MHFLKVNGTNDSHTSNFYGVNSFPSFVALEPGTNGAKWKNWNPPQRNYANMKKWIKGLQNKHNITAAKTEAVTPSDALLGAANKLQNNGSLAAASPITANQPSGALLQQQMDSNKHM